jgi:molecular chaperone DnaK
MKPTIILGIDAGTTRFKFALMDTLGNPINLPNTWGDLATPSVVFFPKEGGVLYGQEALNAGLAEPKRAVLNWKRSMGSSDVLYTDEMDRAYRAEDILELFLKYATDCVRQKTGVAPDYAILSVPANYTDPQKEATKTAVKNSGLNVINLIHEPTAAGLGNQLYKRSSGRFLIYDLGGGTFDVSIIEVAGSDFNVVATNGRQKLGGQDFNDRILERFLNQFEQEQGFRPNREKHPMFYIDAFSRIEQAKLVLTSRPEATIVLSCDGKVGKMTLTRDEFESLTADLLDDSIACVQETLRDKNLTPSQIDEVLAVGGASRMPAISARLEELFGKKLLATVEPDYATAFGNVISCRLELERRGITLTSSGNVALPSLGKRYRDITAHPIGICVIDDQERLLNQVILPKGVPMPSEQVRTFKLVEPDQETALIEILQGPEGMAKDQCSLLGHFELSDLPPQKELSPRIEIKMHIDSSGMLTASARDLVSGKTGELIIDYKNRTA